MEVLDKALFTKLNGTSGVTSLLSSASAIYKNLAPVGSTMPYIVYGVNGGGSDNETQLDSVNQVYFVRAVGTNQASLAAIGTAIRNALHNADLTVTGGWTNFNTEHTVDISYVETVDRVQYYHEGGLYRIQISQ